MSVSLNNTLSTEPDTVQLDPDAPVVVAEPTFSSKRNLDPLDFISTHSFNKHDKALLSFTLVLLAVLSKTLNFNDLRNNFSIQFI